MDTAQFLLVSADATLITDLAWQVHRGGHDVRYYIEAESDGGIGDGFVPKTDGWRAEVEWADVVVPNLYYRDDIGERWIEGDDDRLLAWGYLGPSDT